MNEAEICLEMRPCGPFWPGGQAKYKGLILFANEIWKTSTVLSFLLKNLILPLLLDTLRLLILKIGFHFFPCKPYSSHFSLSLKKKKKVMPFLGIMKSMQSL